MLYVFHDGEYFATVNDNLEIRRVKDINRASYWTEKRTAKSWEKKIKINHPKMELKNAGLTLIEK
jgi:hypothetical protein